MTVIAFNQSNTYAAALDQNSCEANTLEKSLALYFANIL